MGELFRATQQQLLELTLWERLVKVFFKLLTQLITILNIDLDQTMERLTQNDQISKQLLTMLNALNEFTDNAINEAKTDNVSVEA